MTGALDKVAERKEHQRAYAELSRNSGRLAARVVTAEASIRTLEEAWPDAVAFAARGGDAEAPARVERELAAARAELTRAQVEREGNGRAMQQIEREIDYLHAAHLDAFTDHALQLSEEAVRLMREVDERISAARNAWLRAEGEWNRITVPLAEAVSAAEAAAGAHRGSLWIREVVAPTAWPLPDISLRLASGDLSPAPPITRTIPETDVVDVDLSGVTA